jgi:signal transduction histidine kinase
VKRAWSKRTVLRAGFGAVLAVLVLSAGEAYRIQSGIAREHLEIYRSYVEQERILAVLRRNLWLAGNYVRDFFIKTTPEQAAILDDQLRSLKDENELALSKLPHGVELDRIRTSVNEFWAVLEPVPRTMLKAGNDERFDFLQRVVVPRRGELYTAMLALTDSDNRKLQEGEFEFNESRKRASWRLLAMLGVGVLLSLSVAQFSLRHSEHLEQEAERQYAETEHTKGELKRLSARLLEMEEEGKRQLSRELHDEIGQSLALLQIEVSHALASARRGPATAGDTELRDHLVRARELAERTVQTIRNISLLLRPALLDDLGLVPALQFQLEDFLRRSGIACDFSEEGVADELPDPVKTCVYRVVQEALHNCEKHSRATRVGVSVRQDGTVLVAEVKDNGRGFVYSEQEPPVSAGLGLLGMRERASNAGGTLTVDSAPGKGARVLLRIPLTPHAALENRREVTA